MKFADLKKLQQKKYRRELGFFLIEGEHPILELQKAARANPRLQRCKLYVSRSHEHWQSQFETHRISDVQMARLSDTRTPQGIMALVPILPPAAPRPDERAIYLYEVQDPGNLGTVLRTLAWFGKFRCLLSPGSVDPYNAKVVRASMGAIFHVPIELDVNLDSLQTRFGRIACLDLNGTRLQSPQFRTFKCYLFGNEARGLAREHLAALEAPRFTIEGGGAIESLNLAAAVNICLYELNR